MRNFATGNFRVIIAGFQFHPVHWAVAAVGRASPITDALPGFYKKETVAFCL